jgi:peptide/nickel transport system substrate-binding protein
MLNTRVSRRRLLGSGIAAAAQAALVTSCARSNAPAVTPIATKVQRGGELTSLLLSTTNNLNPVTNFQEGYVLSGVHVYDRLISTRPTLDFSSQYRLEAAASVEQADPMTIIFKLKAGMRYHDLPPANGRDVAAADVVASQTYVRDNPRAENNSFQTSSMDSIQAPDPQTVVFKLKAPNAYVFSGTQMSNCGAQCIIPPQLLDKLDTARPVGSGPYQADSYELGVRYRYKRFSGYREAPNQLPYLDARSWIVLQDSSAAEAAFRSGQARLWHPLPDTPTAERLKDMPGKASVLTWNPMTMQTFNANASRAPWNDVRVREALYRVVNRQQHVALASQGQGMVPPGPLSAGLTAYQLDTKQTDSFFSQDARAARQLLDAAAFPYQREFELICMDTSPRDNQSAQILQQQLASVGIKVRITPLPFADWLPNRMAKGDYDLNVNFHPAYDSPQVPMREQTRDPRNLFAYGGLRDPEIDRMIFKSETILNRDEQIQAVKDIQTALLDRYTPMIFLQSYRVFAARYNGLQGYELNPAERPEPMYHLDMWLEQD